MTSGLRLISGRLKAIYREMILKPIENFAVKESKLDLSLAGEHQINFFLARRSNFPTKPRLVRIGNREAGIGSQLRRRTHR